MYYYDGMCRVKVKTEKLFCGEEEQIIRRYSFPVGVLETNARKGWWMTVFIVI
jgi:hypothetical protein